MFSIESLYKDKQIDSFIKIRAQKNLLSFNDFKNQVFLEAIESKVRNEDDFKRALYRTEKRMKKRSISNYSLSLPNPELIAYEDPCFEIVNNGGTLESYL